MIHDAKRPRAQGTRKRGPRASARSEARNVLEFRLMHFACLDVRAGSAQVRTKGQKLGQRNIGIGQRPYTYLCLPVFIISIYVLAYRQLHLHTAG